MTSVSRPPASIYLDNNARRRVLGLAIAATVILLISAIAIFVGLKDPESRTLASDLLFPVFDLAVIAAFVYAALRSRLHSRRLGIAWGVMALGQFTWFMGDLLWLYFESILNVSPYPTVADAFYLSHYLLFLAGVLLLPGARRSRFDRAKDLLDSAAVVVGATVVYWTFWVSPMADPAWSKDTFTLIVSIGYPASDLVLIWTMMSLLMRRLPGLPRWPLALLGMSAMVSACVDLAYANIVASAAFASGGYLDLGWHLAAVLLLWAGATQAITPAVSSPETEDPASDEGSAWRTHTRFAVPYLSLLGAFGLLFGIVNANAPDWLRASSQVVQPGAAILVVLISVRQWLTLIENARLSARLTAELSQRRQTEDELRGEIAARRAAQSASEESQRLLQRVTGAVPSSLYVLKIRAANGIEPPVFTNRSVAALLGYPPAVPETKGWARFLTDIVHPDDRQRFLTHRDAWPNLADGEVVETELRMLDARGHWRWMLGRHLAFERDANGAVSQVIGVLEDVDARKQLQDAVQAERDFAQVVLNALGQGVAVMSSNGVCEYINPAGSKIIGVPSPREMVGVNVLDLATTSASSEAQATMRDFARSPQALRFDAQYRRADDRTVDLATVITPRFDLSGEVSGTVAVFSDVTDRKAMEHELAQALADAQELTRVAQAATQAKSDFLANMSHEIRTPMNAIIGMAELLQDADMPAEQRERVQVIIDSGLGLLGIINDILDFSKIEAGRLELDPHDFSLTGLVEGAVDLFAQPAREKGLRLHAFVDPAIPHGLVGDSVRLRQVLLNLLSNAVKFTSAGHVIIRADANGTAEAGAHIRLSVKDTGIGIEPEAFSRMFQPFEQAENSTTRRFGGTGLGLAIVRRLIDLMGGDVQLESKPGLGTTITLTLTLPIAEAPPRETRLIPRRAIVVEPDPLARDIVVRYLRGAGLACEASGDASMVLAALHGPDDAVVVVGLWPDDMRAELLLEQLRTDAALAGRPRIVIGETTGDSADPASTEGKLGRPLKRGQLLAALDYVSHETAPERVVAVSPAEPPAALGHTRILLVEDNPINQKVASLQLERLGLEVEVATDGEAAIHAYQAEPERFDLILMDCQMPVLDGFEATRRIRAWEAGQPHSPHIAIVAMTANAMAGDREECLSAGMDDYLSKPVKRQDLSEVLGRHLSAVQMTASSPP